MIFGEIFNKNNERQLQTRVTYNSHTFRIASPTYIELYLIYVILILSNVTLYPLLQVLEFWYLLSLISFK